MKLASALVAFALLATPSLAQTDAADPAIRPVKLMTVAPHTNGTKRQFFGLIVARQTVDLAFQVAGQIVKLPAVEGEQVEQGALVAQLDLEPFELQLEQAQLNFDQAERTLERLESLAGTASRVSIDDARTQLGLAKVALRNAQYSLEHATLSAPFDALIAARSVANFTTVAAGTAVVRVHDLSELRIEIDVPEILFQRAASAKDISLTAKFPLRDEVYPLEVREFDAQASAIGQTFRLTLALPRPENFVVLPGASVTVTAEMSTGEAQPIIPNSAVRIANDGSVHAMIFTEGENGVGMVTQQPIEIEATREGRFRVLSGLSLGDEIVATGVAALKDGQTVRRFASFSN